MMIHLFALPRHADATWLSIIVYVARTPRYFVTHELRVIAQLRWRKDAMLYDARRCRWRLLIIAEQRARCY